MIAHESKNFLVMFLGEEEFHTAAASHFIAKKAGGVTAQSLSKDLFQSVDDDDCKGRADKASYIPEFTQGVRITMFRQPVTLKSDSLPMDAVTPPVSPDMGGLIALSGEVLGLRQGQTTE